MTTPQTPMDQLWPLTVTVPAGTPPTAPLIVPWPLIDANLDYIDIIVPDGHSGQTGIAVYWSGTQILPWGTNSWIIANNEKIHTPITTYITIGGLEIYAYNTGQFDHSFYLRGHITYTTAPTVTAEGTIGTSQVLSSVDSSYDESLTPTGISALASPEESTSGESLEDETSGSISGLPESVS